MPEIAWPFWRVHEHYDSSVAKATNRDLCRGIEDCRYFTLWICRDYWTVITYCYSIYFRQLLAFFFFFILLQKCCKKLIIFVLNQIYFSQSVCLFECWLINVIFHFFIVTNNFFSVYFFVEFGLSTNILCVISSWKSTNVSKIIQIHANTRFNFLNMSTIFLIYISILQ